MVRLTMAGALAAFVALSPVAQAQDYPTREIKTVSGFGPGTGGDATVRYYAIKLQAILGKPVIVEQKYGASNTIATETVARARPDGYTLAIMPGSVTLAAAQNLFKKIPFDPVKDFTPVMPLSTLSFTLMVPPDSPFKTLDDLTRFMKTPQAKGIYSGATGSYIACALYAQAIGVKMERVTYRTPGEIYSALNGRDLDFACYDNSSVAPAVKDGKIKALATSGRTRAGALPDVPTFIEQGFSHIALEALWGVYAPAGVPQPIVDKLQAAFKQIMVMPETKTFLDNVANDIVPDGSADKLRAALARDLDDWKTYVRLAEIEPQ